MAISDLQIGYQRFRDAAANDAELFQRLAIDGQRPHTLWIGCSDSRTIPERIVDAKPGELFVLRAIANLIPPFGTAHDAIGAVIEFAVQSLGVNDIIICGHTDCGGIKALTENIDMARVPHLARWVELARPALARVPASIPSPAQRLREAIQANALLQRANLQTYPCVQKAQRANQLTTHAWVFDIAAREVQRYDDASRAWLPLAPDA